MIHLELPDIGSAWQSTFVESIEIIKNDNTEVIAKLPKLSMIGMQIHAEGLDSATGELSLHVSVNGKQWYPYCIHQRANVGNSIQDTPKPLKVTIPSNGDYTYTLDTWIPVKYLKMVQEDSSGNYTISLISDCIW